MKPTVYLDGETFPTLRADIRAAIAADITPPGNMSKPETIAAWEAEKKPGLIEEAIARTSFDGSAGMLAMIGFAVNDAGPVVLSLDEFPGFVPYGTPGFEASWAAGEKLLLHNFFAALASVYSTSVDRTPLFVGHNLSAFDLRFIYQRAVVNRVPVPSFFPYDAAPWLDAIYDTMTRWAGPRGTIGLDRLARALGLPGKGDMDGSQVAGMLRDGHWAKVADYCANDVITVREIHQRMTFAEAA